MNDLHTNLNDLSAFLSDRRVFNDVSVKKLKRKDVFGSPIQFGDPFVFLHLQSVVDYSIYTHVTSVVPAVHEYLKSMSLDPQGGYAMFVLGFYPNTYLLSRSNVQRLCREYNFFDSFGDHAFMNKRGHQK